MKIFVETSRRDVSKLAWIAASRGNDNQLEIGANLRKVANQPGKKFTGILPKSRFFGQKWLINMLGEAKMGMAELNSVIAQQERSVIPMLPSKGDYACLCGYDGQLVGYASPNVQSEVRKPPREKVYRNFTEIAFFRAKMAK